MSTGWRDFEFLLARILCADSAGLNLVLTVNFICSKNTQLQLEIS